MYLRMESGLACSTDTSRHTGLHDEYVLCQCLSDTSEASGEPPAAVQLTPASRNGLKFEQVNQSR